MRTNQVGEPVGARRGRRLLLTLLAATTVVITLAGTIQPAAGQPAAPGSPALAGGTPHTVSFDGYSFLIDGQRTYIWSGEFHYFRLPSPSLWLDIFQKMKAAGFNAASIYFDWGYHSPAPGVYDFTGVRDVAKLLNMAQEAGIYVIARPAPYINAEVDGGGRPGRLSAQPGANRSDDPQFLKYSDEGMTRIARILPRHQVTNGPAPGLASRLGHA